MRKMLFAMGLLVMLTGCMSLAGNRYERQFNEAVASGTSRVMIVEEPFDALLKRFVLATVDLGYKKSIYQQSSQGFFVMVKDPKLLNALLSGNAMNHLMMVKFTKNGPGKTRIDLVNAATDFFAIRAVNADIERLQKGLVGSVPIDNTSASGDRGIT